MTDSRTALAPADTDPLTSTPRRRAVLPCWQHLLGEGTLLGLFVWTIRALHEQGAPGVWATVAFWAVMGTRPPWTCTAASTAPCPPPRRSDKWK